MAVTGRSCELLVISCDISPTVTTFRKALSIVISFLFFAKPFTMQ